MVEVTTGIMLFLAAVFDYRLRKIPNALQILALFLVMAAICLADPDSWKMRAMIAVALTALFLLAYLLKQSGGGDVKMVPWFAAGFGWDALGGLVLGVALMSVWILCRALARRPAQWVPLAPFLAVGCACWFAFCKQLS